jgi:hypothetical protein
MPRTTGPAPPVMGEPMHFLLCPAPPPAAKRSLVQPSSGLAPDLVDQLDGVRFGGRTFDVGGTSSGLDPRPRLPVGGYRRCPNVWGFDCLGDTVLGYLKHLISTVLGAGQTLTHWCSIFGGWTMLAFLHSQ